jgi:hypothetical protein
VPRGGESPAQASCGGGPAMEFSVVAWAWSLGPLLRFAMAQPLNKVSGWSFRKISGGLYEFSLSLSSWWRREEAARALVRLDVGSAAGEKQLPGVYSRCLCVSCCTRRPTGGRSHPLRRRRSVPARDSRSTSTSRPRCRFGGPFPLA